METGLKVDSMTQEHVLQLQCSTPELVENMDPDPVIRKLYSQCVLTAKEQAAIKANGRATKEQRVMTLMKQLVAKNDSAFNILIDTLIATEQSHVASIIITCEVNAQYNHNADDEISAGVERAGNMTETHKAQLRAATDQLVDCMNPDPILTSLYSRCVLSMQEMNIIKANGRATRFDKSEHILNILMSKDDSAFQVLLDALRDSEQIHLAQIIVNKQSTSGKTN